MQDQIKPGQLYKHYKGDIYKIITLAKHSETTEWMLIYERQGDGVHTGWAIWARPLEMFFDFAALDGKKVPRFELVS